MKFKIIPFDPADFTPSDGIFALGHFEIESGELKVSLFHQSYGMLILSLTELMTCLCQLEQNNQAHSRSWSNFAGEHILFSFQKIDKREWIALFQENNFELWLNKNDFIRSVFFSANDFSETVLKLNANLLHHEAFRDFQEAVLMYRSAFNLIIR